MKRLHETRLLGSLQDAKFVTFQATVSKKIELVYRFLGSRVLHFSVDGSRQYKLFPPA